jgi:sugar (pentulose or hexulose) kinase
MLPEIARDLELSSEVRVTVAGHDHMVGAVGAGLRRGELLNSTGTTEGLLMLRDAPCVDARAESAKLANGVAPAGDGFTLFASIPTGGSAFATLQGMLGMAPDVLSERIAVVHKRYLADAVDLDTVPIVLPWFRGSPPPGKNADARGVVHGLAPSTTPDDIVLGTFLGMALQFRDVLALFPERPDHIKVIGPAARNPLWLGLKSDLLGMSLSVSGATEVVSRGAQALASGEAPDGSATDPHDVLPHAARHERLTRWAHDIHPLWERLKAVGG